MRYPSQFGSLEAQIWSWFCTHLGQAQPHYAFLRDSIRGVCHCGWLRSISGANYPRRGAWTFRPRIGYKAQLYFVLRTRAECVPSSLETNLRILKSLTRLNPLTTTVRNQLQTPEAQGQTPHQICARTASSSGYLALHKFDCEDGGSPATPPISLFCIRQDAGILT